MARDVDDQGASRWKEKYLDTLENFERREKQWQQLETTLRQGLSRLTLLADDVDPALARQLDALRKALRQGRDSAQLKPLLADIAAAIARLDEQRGRRGTQLAGNQLLARLLDTIKVARDKQVEVRRARKKLVAAGDLPVEKLVDEVARFIESLYDDDRVAAPAEQARPDTKVTPDEPAAKEVAGDKPGLLARLFRREGRGSETATRPGGEVHEVGDDTGYTEEAQFTGVAELADMALAAEVLIQLIERLDLPSDLEAESRVVRADIAGSVDWPRIAGAIAATAELVATMRVRLEAERSELETFLGQLTLRLREIDDGLQETAHIHHKVRASNTQLDDAVSREVGGLEDELSGGDVDRIKQAVQLRVQNIRRHLDAFRSAQEADLGSAQETITQLTEKLQQTEQEAEALRAELEAAHQQALCDPLTGIANRLAWEERLRTELARFERNGTSFCLMVWDVDLFKQVNDTWGHDAGDKVLKILAETLSARMRAVDLVARYGGEEFIVLMADTELEQAMATAEELRQTIAALDFHYREQHVPITASCGVTQCRSGDDGESMFRRADTALYAAKQAGRNRCHRA